MQQDGRRSVALTLCMADMSRQPCTPLEKRSFLPPSLDGSVKIFIIEGALNIKVTVTIPPA